MNIDLQEKVACLPLRPGVYQFFDAQKRLLYIGKATHLRSRVQSYFRASTDLSDAKRRMVALITNLETIVVDTEPEALLLETTLIKQYKPPYNVVMKDDKNFQYIWITDDLFPRIETVRQLYQQHQHGRFTRLRGQFFGPYTSGRAVGRSLRLLQEIFHFCSNPPITKHGITVTPKRPCLDYHLSRCSGPCAGDLSARAYQSIMQQIATFLRGEYEPVQRYLEKEMRRAAHARAYERAARIRDQLHAITALMVDQKVVSPRREHADFLSLARVDGLAAVNVLTVRNGKLLGKDVLVLQHTQHQTDAEVMTAFRDQYYAQHATPPRRIVTNIEKHRGRNREMLAMGVANAEHALRAMKVSWEKNEARAHLGLRELAAAIGQTKTPLHRIEIYDISNVQGRHSVGSMVVFIDGRADPTHYRKFIIRSVRGADDFASMREVITRRVRHLRAGEHQWPRPDLMVMDGGKGQLHAALQALAQTRVDLPVIALAKKKEEIFLPHQSASVRLPRTSVGLQLLQHMRDEAHRFAIGFYRRRHLQDLLHG